MLAYTDGSCVDDHAGCAYLFLQDDHVKYLTSYSFAHGTNQKAELHAIYSCLTTAKLLGLTELTICSDSQYAIKCFSEWYKNWGEKWHKIQNREYIQIVLPLLQDVKVTWVKVKAHATDPYNKIVDKAARAAARKK